ncbi:MAG: hypothetical protein AAF657_01680 [Acidobacteriota bacterium]
MISGLNQEVTVLGRVFHFQTELTRKGELYIRTEIFVGGKIVATRESLLRREQREKLDEDGVRALMKEHHGLVIESTLRRVEKYQSRKPEAEAEEQELPEQATAFDAHQAENLGPPTKEMRDAISSAIRIRRIFGKVRLRLGLDPQIPADEIGKRLATASRGFAWIIRSPTFEEIRVDEQMRCHLVSEQVNAWLSSESKSPAEAIRIWGEIVKFNDYVAEINNRADLMAFDRQLLMWTALQIQRDGISDQILDHLQWLAGRDTEVDRLLDQPYDVSSRDWFAALCQVLARIPSEP